MINMLFIKGYVSTGEWIYVNFKIGTPKNKDILGFMNQ